ncbi:hypothetical protein B0H11DRAFT_1723970, partial [Mycena galericulata]
RLEIFDDPRSAIIVATFELPGVKLSNLSVTVSRGVLMVQGERLSRYPQRNQNPAPRRPLGAVDMNRTVGVHGRPHHVPNDPRLFPIRELRYGAFRRTMRLPDGTEPRNITASLSEGLLSITWPRARTIDYNASQTPTSCNPPLA